MGCRAPCLRIEPAARKPHHSEAPSAFVPRAPTPVSCAVFLTRWNLRCLTSRHPLGGPRGLRGGHRCAGPRPSTGWDVVSPVARPMGKLPCSRIRKAQKEREGTRPHPANKKRRSVARGIAAPAEDDRSASRTPRPEPRSLAASASYEDATWLILPVVICLSQRLSHACVSMN